MSEIDVILNKTFKSEIIKEKFKSNLTKLSSAVEKEMERINSYLSKLKGFQSKKISKLQFESDRKLTDFINGSIQILLMSKKLYSTIRKCEIAVNKDSSYYTAILNCLDKEMRSTTEEGLDGNKMIDENLLNKLKTFDDVSCFSSKNSNSCCICLHELSLENQTNVFSFDFHTSCINFYINLVDSQSPYVNIN